MLNIDKKKFPVRQEQNQDISLFISFIAFFLPSALLINFLAYHQYSLFSLEVILIFLTIAIYAGAVFIIAKIYNTLALLISGFMLFFYFSAISPSVNSIFGLSIPPRFLKIAALVIMLLFLFFSLKFRKSVWRWFAVFSLVVFLTAIATWKIYEPFPHIKKINSEAFMPRNENLPLLIYIIFDEHMSIEWVPEEIPMAQLAKAEMISFYNKYNFLFFPKAFSHYIDSYLSISTTLNFNDEFDTNTIKREDNSRILIENKVFDTLKEKGYRIKVYQSEYMDFCHHSVDAIDFCMQYGNNSIGVLQNINLSVINKALLISGHNIAEIKSTSPFLQRMLEAFQKIIGLIPGIDLLHIPLVTIPYDRVGPLNVSPVMRHMKESVMQNPTGTAFFAHLLTPHYPYVYDENTQIKADPRTWYGPDEWYLSHNGKPSYEERYTHYYRQVRGLYKELDNWFKELDKNGLLKDAIIIFHGDHGSRIGWEEPHISDILHPEWDRRVKDGFSTLFAVKDVGIDSGESMIQKPINHLLEEFFLVPDQLNEDNASGKNFVKFDSDGELITADYNPLSSLN